MAADCKVAEVIVGQSTRAVVLENDLLRAVILADKGADVYELVYKPAGVDVLFKAPWGFHDAGALAGSAPNSQVAMVDHYAGGWQEILPNFAVASFYRGVEWCFHGELLTAGWDYRIVQNSSRRASVRFEISLTRTPFHLERTMTVEAGRPEILIQERLKNCGDSEMPYIWGHHPGFGAPFLSPDCWIDVPAQRYRVAMPQVYPSGTWMPDEGEWPWPNVVGRDGQTHDMRQIPGPESRLNTLGVAVDLDEGWYGLTNRNLGFGIGFVWPQEIFPHLWILQELNSTPSYPWYGRGYVVALEFISTPTAGGILETIETGSERRLAAGASQEVEIRCLFYQSANGVERIRPDGRVEVRQ